MNKKIFAVGMILSLLLVGCGSPKLQDGKELVSTLEGKDITTEDLYNELKNSYGQVTLIKMIDSYIANKEITDNKAANSYADGQIKQMKEYYEKQGYNFEDMVKSNGYSSIEEFKKQIAAQYKKEQVAKNTYKKEVTDKEIEAYYKSEIFGEMTVKHILIEPDVEDTATDAQKKKAEEKALKEAQDLIKKIKKGEKFEDLAKKYSDDKGTATEGGLFEDFTKQKVDPDFWKASYNLKNKEYTKEPVKSQFGYHIILKVSQKEKPALKDVKDSIIDTLVAEKMQKENAVEKAWTQIRKNYKLEINDSQIKKAYDEAIKSLNKTSSK